MLAETVRGRQPSLDGAAAKGLARVFLEGLPTPPSDLLAVMDLADRFLAWSEKARSDVALFATTPGTPT